MTSQTVPDLDHLGDQLERAAARNLAADRRRRRLRGVGLGVIALTVIATGGAVATGMFAPRQVAAGMPAGSAIFGDRHPSCVLAADGVTYNCTLDAVPLPEGTGVAPASLKPGTSAVPALAPDYLGWKELIGVDGVVAGGCVGRDHAGLSWDCYVGQAAVAHGILTTDVLGQPMTVPGRG